MANKTRSSSLGLGFICATAATAMALGCGSDIEGPTGSISGGAGIKGSYLDTFASEGGEATAPHGADGLTLEALVPGSDSSWERHSGALQGDGTFEIPGVPAGVYYLKVQEGTGAATFYVTEERTIELGSSFRKRRDAELATKPTSLLFDVSGLSPWKDSDTIELYSPGAGTFGSFIFLLLMNTATSVSDEVKDVTTFSSPGLIDGAKGDEVYVTQLIQRQGEGLPYQAIERALRPAPFTQADGQSASISGSFEDTPKTQIAVNFKRSLFAELAADVSPSAAVFGTNIYLYAEPGGPSRRTEGPYPTLALLYDPMAASDFTAYMSYGNPFPPAWDTVAVGLVVFSVYYAVPGSDAPQLTRPRIDCRISTASASGQVAFTPSIHPVKDILVNGASASGDVSGVGVSPSLSWSAPAVGTVGHYRVTVRELSSASDPKDVASFYTTGTSVSIPEGIMREGAYYYARITADTVGLDLADRDASGGYGCYADAVTGLLTP